MIMEFDARSLPSLNTFQFHFPFRAFQVLSEDFGTSAGILRPIYVQGDLQD